MCTVTYLPVNNGFIITSNRDESVMRKPAEPPAVIKVEDTEVLFPRDGEAGGTWFATAKNGRTVCLLNGAFHPHKRQPPYRKSRGLVVLDFFAIETVGEFIKNYELDGIEPFTLVVAEYNRLYELRWDGNQKYYKELDNAIPHIRSSATLYTEEVIALREQWFAKWLVENKSYQPESILKFHLFAGAGDEGTKIRMSRAGIVKTVSITCVSVIGNAVNMWYSNLEGSDYYFSNYNFDEDHHNKRDDIVISAQG